VALAGDQRLDRAGAAVLDRLGEPHRGMRDDRALVRRERGRGCFLHHLLVPALERAVALEHVHGAALPVAQHLHLDVPRVLEQLLHVHALVPERRRRHTLRRLDRLREVLGVVRRLHALAAAAERRLDDDRVAHGVRRAHERFRIRALGAGHDRHARGIGETPGFALVAHGADLRRRGPDEREPGGRPPPRRTPRSRRGSRSRDGRRRRRTRARRSPRRRCSGSSRAPPRRRSSAPRRRRACAARRGRPRSRPPRCGCPSRAAWRRRGR
jgi:hypothetical protein